MSNPLGWSPDQLWGNQERLWGGKTKLKLERWKGINIGGSELHPYSPTHPKTPPPSSHDVQGTSRGGQRRFTFVRIKKKMQGVIVTVALLTHKNATMQL